MIEGTVRRALVLLSAASVCCGCFGTSWTIFTAGPIPDFDVGSGKDGPLSVSGGSVAVNACQLVVHANNETVELSGPAPTIGAGDVVLLLQLQDGPFATVGDQSPISNPLTSGLWELARVSTVGTALTLASPLANTYSSVGPPQSAELCRVPQFSDVTIAGGALIATPWNPNTGIGGVLALMVSGTLSLGSGGMVTASGSGFPGGVASGTTAAGCSVVALSTVAADGGAEGQGLTGNVNNYGRGNLANAGGGGNSLQSGGGGGGGGGAGGAGGRQDAGCPNPGDATWGLPGAALALPVGSRFAFGGGGGGGDIVTSGGAGGNGGGIVFIQANRIQGAGAIGAQGGAGGLSTAGAGAGGGGGGGTVWVRAYQSAYSGTIDARGGQGGGTVSTFGGPGGGGGGGRVSVRAFLGSGFTIVVTGGTAGIQSGTGTPFGAQPGSSGSIERG